MPEDKDKLMVAFRKMMKDSGRIARKSPIFKNDIIDFDNNKEVKKPR